MGKSLFRLELDALEFAITRDDQVTWRGSLRPNINTYGYSAKDLAGKNYILKSKGFFWWRNLELHVDSVLVDRFTLYRSSATGIRIDRRQFLVDGNNNYICSIQNDHTKTENGLCLFNWECAEESILPQVVTMLIMKHQGRSQPYGI